MSKWIPWMMLAALTVFSGCKKSEPAKAETPAIDTAAALPAPPELEPVDEMFADSVLADTATTETAAAPTTSPAATPAASAKSAPQAAPAPKSAPATPKTVASKPAAAPVAAAGLSEKGAYTLQVGIFNNERQANRTAEKLKAQGFPAYVTRVQDPKPSMPGTYFRVRVGSFVSSQAARAYGEANLAPAGVDFWADLKGRDTQALPQASKPNPAATAPAPETPAPSKPVEATPAATSATPVPASATEPAPAKQDTKPATSLPDW